MIKVIFFLATLLVNYGVFAADILVASVAEANTALATAKPNDRVILQVGTYKDAIIKFTNINITFLAQEPGKVIFTGNSTLSFGGSYNKVEGFVWKNGGKDLGTKSVVEFRNDKTVASYCTISNCVIDEYNTVDYNTDNKWVSVYGTYNTVEKCLLANKYNRGATLVVWLEMDKPAYHTISHNYFYNRQNGPNVDNGLESIRIGDSKTSFTHAHCVVAFNRFEKCDGEIEIISNKSCYNSYLHNTFVDSDGGLTLRHGNYCRVEGNFFDGREKDKAYGVRFIGEGHVAVNNFFINLKGSPSQSFRAPLTLVNGVVNTAINGYFQVKRAFVQGNIFVNCVMPAIRVGAYSKRDGMTLAPDSVLISDNIIADNMGNSGDVYEVLTTPTNLQLQNNIVVGKKLSFKESGFSKLGAKSFTIDGFNTLVNNENGKALYNIQQPVIFSSTSNVGAAFTPSKLARLLIEKRYTYLTEKEVGPVWMR